MTDPLRPSTNALRFAFAFGFIADIGMFIHAGWVKGLMAWAALGILVLVSMGWISGGIARIPEATQRRILVAGAILTAAVVAVLYPLANAQVIPGMHERDELIKGGLGYLFSGRNPYEFQLGARAPISPFPTWLILNIPFYLLGKLSPHDALYGLQNIAALVVVYLLWRRVIGTSMTTYALFLLALSLALPNIAYELIAGSDYLADGVMVTAMATTAIFASERVAANRWLMVLTGFAFVSRLHFGLLFAPIAGYYLGTVGFRETVRRLTWMAGPAALVALAFWAIEPSRFMPIHTSNYLGEWEGATAQFDAALHFNTSFIVDASVTMLTVAVLTFLSYRKARATATMLAEVAIVGTPILVAFITNSIRHGEVYLGPFSSHSLAVVILLAAAVALAPYGSRADQLAH